MVKDATQVTAHDGEVQTEQLVYQMEEGLAGWRAHRILNSAHEVQYSSKKSVIARILRTS